MTDQQTSDSPFAPYLKGATPADTQASTDLATGQGGESPFAQYLTETKQEERGPLYADVPAAKAALKEMAKPPETIGPQVKMAQDNAAIQTSLDQNGGGTFDPKGEPIKPGLAFNIAQQIGKGNNKNALQVFNQSYPRGQLVQVPYGQDGDTALLYQEDPDKPFKRLGYESSIQTLAKAANLRNAGMVAGGILTGGSPGGVAAGSGLGSFIGDVADWGWDKLRGLSADVSGPQEGGHAAMEGLWGGLPVYGLEVGKGLYTAGTQGIKAIVGRVSPDLGGVITESAQEGLHPLSIGQTSTVPTVRQFMKSAAASSPIYSNLRLAQMDSVRQRLEGIVADNGFEGTSTGTLQGTVQAEANNIVSQLPLFKLTGKSPTGMDLQAGLQAYDTNAQALIKRLGDTTAVGAEDFWVGMPTAPMKDAVKDIERGVLAPGADLETGTASEDTQGGVQLAGPARPIAPYIAKINALGDKLENFTGEDGTVHNAFNQYQALRDGLYDLWQNSKDDTTREQAFSLWKASQDMLSRAQSDVAGKQGRQGTALFQTNMKNFSDTYNDYETTKTMVKGLMNSQTPGDTAFAMIRPGALPRLTAVKNALDGTPQQPAWDALGDGYRSMLANDLNKAGDRIFNLQQQDPGVIDLIMSRDEQESWKLLSANQTRLDNSLASKMAQGETGAVSNAMTIAREGSAGEVGRMAATPETAQSIKAGVYQDIMDRSRVAPDPENASAMTQDTSTLDPKKLVDAIQYYQSAERREALDSVMTPADWKRLSIMSRYASIVSQDSGINPSLAAAERAQMLRLPLYMFTEPERYAMGLYQLVNNHGWASVLANPVSASLFDKSLAAGPTSKGVSMLAASVGAAFHEQTRQDLLGYQTQLNKQ